MKYFFPLLLATFVISVWLGESRDAIWEDLIWSGTVAIIAAVLSILMIKKKWVKIICAILTFVISALGLYLGEYSASRAFNDCAKNAENLRVALDVYHDNYGRYPKTISELPTLPCRRFIRGSLLDYNLTEKGYSLEFSDWLITFSASESDPFIAHK